MITILKSGYSKIMQLFYRDKTRELHLREISRQAKLHVPSVTRFLNVLEKDNILKSQKDANLKKYSIKKSRRTYVIFEIFDIEKFEKISNIRKNAINIFLDNLSEKPIFVILFGSTAKETYRRDSDIDIMLITNNKISTLKSEQEVDALTGIKMGIFQIKYKDFLMDLKIRDDKVLQSAIESGYPLINHIEYYRVIYDARI